MSQNECEPIILEHVYKRILLIFFLKCEHNTVSRLITFSVHAANDDDEPYSPEDDEPYSPGALDEEHENDTSLDLQREMEAINRQIEEQKQQIESISSSLPQVHAL